MDVAIEFRDRFPELVILNPLRALLRERDAELGTDVSAADLEGDERLDRIRRVHRHLDRCDIYLGYWDHIDQVRIGWELGQLWTRTDVLVIVYDPYPSHSMYRAPEWMHAIVHHLVPDLDAAATAIASYFEKPAPVPSYFAAYLKEVRQAYGVTQMEIADLMGLSLSGYKALEGGKRFPSAQTLHGLLKWKVLKPEEIQYLKYLAGYAPGLKDRRRR